MESFDQRYVPRGPLCRTHRFTQSAITHHDSDDGVLEVPAEYFDRSLEEGV